MRTIGEVAAELQQLEAAHRDGAIPESAYTVGRAALLAELNELSAKASAPEPEPAEVEPEPEPAPEPDPVDVEPGRSVRISWWHVHLAEGESATPYQLMTPALLAYVALQAWWGGWGVAWLWAWASGLLVAWIVADAHAQRRAGAEGLLGTTEPWKWAVPGFLIWILGVPVYLAARLNRTSAGAAPGLFLAMAALTGMGLQLLGIGQAYISWECMATGPTSAQCSYWNEGEGDGHACFDLVANCADGEHRSKVCSDSISPGSTDVQQVTSFRPKLTSNLLMCALSIEDPVVQ